MNLKSLLIGGFLATTFFAQAQCPQITCPSDINVTTDPGSCDAVVTYTAPVGTDPCQGNITYSYTGAAQTFTVPNGVTSITIDAYGAQGGDNGTVLGGEGGYATGTLTVTPGEVLNIYVGGKGSDNPGGGQNCNSAGGFNGGGSTGATCCSNAGSGAGAGGGASDVRQGGATLNDRVIVAAGGGGAGDNETGAAGGGLQGQDGGTYNGVTATGGTQTAGGIAGGTYYPNHTCSPATDGSFGQGGEGDGNDAGGGGGGWYGGGGGANNGAGAGGSSYIGGVTSGSTTTGGQTGDGEIVISWTATGSTTTTQIAGQASGSTFALGTNVQTFEVSDGNGNTDQCSFNIIVTDNNDPVADNANLADVEASCEVNSLTAPTATDLCDGSITGVSDAVFPIDNDTVVVWTYTDAEGNAVTQNQNVVITGVDVGISLSGATITADNANADSYQWIDCSDSSTVADANGQSFTPSANGDYAVIVTEGNCSDTSACESITTVSTTNFDNGTTVSVYPNPNNGQFTVDFGGQVAEAIIKIYDLQGKLVNTYRLSDVSTQPIDLKDQKGVFMIHVTTDKGNQNFRVVAE